MEVNLLEYDTVIFDLDETLWKGSRLDFWAKKLSGNIHREKDKIIDENGDYIELQNGIREVLEKLKSKRKNIGFITRGGLLDTEHDEQLVVRSLKMLDVYSFFNHQKSVLYKTDLKSRAIKPERKTIYIDDNNVDLSDMFNNNIRVDLLNRHDFNDWFDLLCLMR